MHQKLFTFPSQISPEFSGLFQERRVVFEEVQKPEPTVASTKVEKKGEEETLQSFLEGKLSTLKEGITDEIDTDTEKDAVKKFLTMQKHALDSLKDDIKGISDVKSIGTSLLDNDVKITKIEELEGVHDSIFNLIESDVKYTESQKLSEKSDNENKNENKEKESVISEKMKEVGEFFSQKLGVLKLESILEKKVSDMTEKEKVAVMGSILILAGKNDLDVLSDEDISGKNIPEELHDFSGKIEEIFTEILGKKDEPENSGKKMVFSKEEGVLFLSEEELAERKKSGETSEKNIEKTPTTKLGQEIKDIEGARNAYKKHANEKMKGSFWVKILSMFGIDLGDPTQDSMIHKALRYSMDISDPDEGDFEGKNYEYSQSELINNQVITPFLNGLKTPKKVSLPSLGATRISQKAKDILTGAKKLNGKDDLPASVSNMASDVLGRIPNAKILTVGKGRMKIDLKAGNPQINRVQMETLMQNSGGGSLSAMSGMVSGLLGDLQSSLSSIDGIGDMVDSALEDESGGGDKDFSGIESTRKNLGYPKITGYTLNQKTNVAIIDFDTSAQK